MKKLISLTLLLLIVACSPLQRNNNSTSGLNGFETQEGVISYFVNDSVDQYFIKPLKFKSKEFEVHPDFTFRTGDESTYINVNFSIFSRQVIQKEDLKNILYPTEIKEIKKMYVESKSNKKIESRFSGKIEKTNFRKVTTEQNWIIKFKDGKEASLSPNKKTRKTQDVFEYISL